MAEIAALKAKAAARNSRAGRYAKYALDPAGYARDVLGVEWWGKQREIAEALTRPPHRVLVKASHSVGKSHLVGGLVNWWYDCYDPGVVLTTAPTARQVRDVIWKEVRRQRAGRGGFPGPKIPRLESSPTHFAAGFTAADGTAAQGQHEANVLLVIDEAVGVHRAIWEAFDSMAMGVNFAYLAMCNPTDPGSEFYAREQGGGWHVVHIPCLEHPNVAAELAGDPPPYPSAVRLSWVNERLAEWASPVAGPPLPTDVQWPPGSGAWLRPGPLAEARLLGRWPSAAAGVWSDAAWGACEAATLEPGPLDLPRIGVDVARFGDDFTAFHVRWGPCSVHHERHNGWDAAQVCGRLKQLCREWAAIASVARNPAASPIRPEQVVCNVDEDGFGSGVIDHREGFAFVGVSAARTADSSDDYPNTRSELWFSTASRARAGRLDVSRLPANALRDLKRQALAPHYTLDAAGRRVVEPKAKTKQTLGFSPDDVDALNLAYYEAGQGGAATWVDTDRRGTSARQPRHRR